MSISVVVPFSVISSGGQSQTGIENAVFGARYRQDLPGLTRAWSGKGAYVMGAGGIEVPTGTVDRSFGEGAPALVSAGLFSFEKGAFSIISYGFFHRYGVYEGVRDSGHVFVGTGVAWTPLALHPTAIVAAGKHALVFVVTSINVGEQWRDPFEHENFRLGVGTILKLGQ